MNEAVYLDYAATTPVDPRVAATMAGCIDDRGVPGNAASRHGPGRAARARVEQAAAQAAALINATAEEIIWTSGATESDNLAVIGGATFRQRRGRHVVTALTEHPAVLESCRFLETQGYSVTYLRPDASGIVAPDDVEAALTAETVLVSIMHANNEIGVVQDVEAIGALCRRNDVLFHVDAAQSAAWLPIDVRAFSIDLLSLSAHKMYGPQGVGALYVCRETAGRVAPLMQGGGQQRGIRPGTLPVHQLAGMGMACEIAAAEREESALKVSELRDQLRAGLLGVDGVLLNGDPSCCVPHIVSVCIDGVDGDSLLDALEPLAVSSGSACASESDEPSAVLRCLGRDHRLAAGALRFSLGRPTTKAQIEFAIERFAHAVARLRRAAPAAGDIEAGEVRGRAVDAASGTEIVFSARIDGGRIRAMTFKARGCPDTVSACQYVAESLTEQPVRAMLAVEPLGLEQALKLPAGKRGRLLVVQDALRNCFADWDNRRLTG